MGTSPLPVPRPPGTPPQGPGAAPRAPGPGAPPQGPATPPKGPGAPPQGPATPSAGPGTPVPLKTPAVCTGVPLLNLACAQLTGAVGPSAGTKPGPPPNNAADVLLIQKLINLIVQAGYMDGAVLGAGPGKPIVPLAPNGMWSTALFNSIKQIEVLYFHGRANPHGIGMIDPQADESMFTFLVELANGSQKAKQQLSVQMSALAVAMVPAGTVMIDVGGNGPDGKHVPQKVTAIQHYLPILLDALTHYGLTDTDMVMMAIACARTETTYFKPITEPEYDLNTTGTYTDSKTGEETWTSTTEEVHNDYGKLTHHHYLQSSTGGRKEKFAPGSDKGDIYQTNSSLGNTQPGDGWKFRGRGLIQLTGRALYTEACLKVGVGDLFLTDPEQVNSDKWAGMVVAAYLKAGEAKIRRRLDAHDLKGARKAVNGGKNGLDAFVDSWNAGLRIIAEAIIVQAKAKVRSRRKKHVKKKHA